MKKIFFIAAAVLFVTAANAKVWRINYDENANADFRTISAACAAAKVADTDTLYCEAGYHAGSASDNNISRSGMTVVGPGWGYAPNYGNTSTIAEARFSSNITISADNVKVEGVVCNGAISLGNNSRTNVVVERCLANEFYWSGVQKAVLENCDILNNYITNRLYIYGTTEYSVGNNASVRNVNIIGNVIISNYEYGYGLYLYGKSDQFNNINIINNTILGNKNRTDYPIILTINSLIQDNIIINTANETFVMNFNLMGNIIRKNVFSLSQDNVSTVISEKYPDNYYVGATVANTFVNTTTGGYYDEAMKYQVLETSPAKGGAYDGGDCGAFGGANPYVLNGRPQGIPYIYDVEVPAQPKDNKLHVTFKVKGQNE